MEPMEPGTPATGTVSAGQTPQPVAYDADGRPLYAHPPQPQTQVVYMARPIEPHKPELSDEMLRRHEESKRTYPSLNLSHGEYVISDIPRHPIGLVSIWGVVTLLLGLSFIGLLFVNANKGSIESFSGGSESALGWFVLLVLSFCLLVVVGGIILTHVYLANRFILTNESVIQFIQYGLFSKREQTVSLANIEDASYRQHGVMEHLLNYGSLRLSTEGDETTYRFNYAPRPQYHIKVLNNAVEAFKNGRPIDPYDN